MNLPHLQTSWDPPISHQHSLLYLPTSSKETRHCCWCWFSSVPVKHISLSGFSPTRSMSFDGLPKMRWKWNPLKWEQKATQHKDSQLKVINQGRDPDWNTPHRLQSLGLLPPTHIHTEWKQTGTMSMGADVYSPCRHWPSCLLHNELPRASLEEVHLMFALQAGEGSWGRWSDSVC